MKITNLGTIFLTIIFILYSVSMVIGTENQLQEEENKKRCNSYCKHCGCMGFYCGEECICECNKFNNIGGDCITAVLNDAQRVKVPFEILIRSPNANKLIQDDKLKLNAKLIKTQRGKRSTIVIYRPARFSLVDDKGFDDISKIHMKVLEAKREILKRQVQSISSIL